MDFSWTEEQLEFKKTIIEFAQKELNDNVLERDASSNFSHENWLKCAHIGIQGLAVPEDADNRNLEAGQESHELFQCARIRARAIGDDGELPVAALDLGGQQQFRDKLCRKPDIDRGG